MLVASWRGEGEPEYKGKRLSEWVEIYPGNPTAERAIVALSTNMLPQLVKWLEYRPSKARLRVDENSDKLPRILSDSGIVRWLLRDRADERAYLALYTLEVLGLRAAPTIPQLLSQAQRNAGGPA